jgi:hypothetical protein
VIAIATAVDDMDQHELHVIHKPALILFEGTCLREVTDYRQLTQLEGNLSNLIDAAIDSLRVLV